MSKKKPKAKVVKTGRPSGFSKHVAEALCARIADGESLRQICSDPEMPGKRTVFSWLQDNTEFQHQYARARDQQAASYADDIVDIADTEPDPQRARVRIDARKWHASKLAPKKYGDKLAIGGDEENPLTVVHEAGKTLDAKIERLIGRRASET